MSFEEEWRRACEPDSRDGPVVLRLKEILEDGLPAAPLGEVVYFPTHREDGLTQRLDPAFQDGESLVKPLRRRGSGRRNRRPQSGRWARAVQYLSESVLRAHGGTISRGLRHVKRAGARRARTLP